MSLNGTTTRQAHFFKSAYPSVLLEATDDAAIFVHPALTYTNEYNAWFNNGTTPEHIQGLDELSPSPKKADKKSYAALVTGLKGQQAQWNARNDAIAAANARFSPPSTTHTTAEPARALVSADPSQPKTKTKPDLQAIINEYDRTTGAWSAKWLFNATSRKVSNTQYDKRQKRKATLEILEKIKPLTTDQIIICLQALHNFYAREGAYNSYMLKAIDQELVKHDPQFRKELERQPKGNFNLDLNKTQKGMLLTLVSNLGDYDIRKSVPRFAFFVEALEKAAVEQPTLKKKSS